MHMVSNRYGSTGRKRRSWRRDVVGLSVRQRGRKAHVDSCMGHYIERGYRLVCLKSAASGRKEKKRKT